MTNFRATSNFRVTPRTCDLLLLIGFDFLDSRSSLKDPLRDYKVDAEALAKSSKSCVGLDRPLRKSDIEKDYLPRLYDADILRSFPFISATMESVFSNIRRFGFDHLGSVNALILGYMAHVGPVSQRQIRSFLGADFSSHGNWVAQALENLIIMDIPIKDRCDSLAKVQTSLSGGEIFYSLPNWIYLQEDKLSEDLFNFLNGSPSVPDEHFFDRAGDTKESVPAPSPLSKNKKVTLTFGEYRISLSFDNNNVLDIDANFKYNVSLDL